MGTGDNDMEKDEISITFLSFYDINAEELPANVENAGVKFIILAIFIFALHFLRIYSYSGI